jgi:CDP-diacylglycerol--serine O-phosphatidyltransferase
MKAALNWRQVVPTMITLAAMLAGFLSILFTVEGMRQGGMAMPCSEYPFYLRSAQMIMLSMILDGLDGNVARWLKGESEFGAELDTYVDMTAFGIAPAILVFAVTLHADQHPVWRVVLPSAVALSGVVRLARFKVVDSERGQGGYAGLPITGNAAWVALFVFLSQAPPMRLFGQSEVLSLQAGWFRMLFLVGIVIFIVLQVTNVRYPKPTKNVGLFSICVVLVSLFLMLGTRAAVPIALVMLLLGLGWATFGPFIVARGEARKVRHGAPQDAMCGDDDGCE